MRVDEHRLHEVFFVSLWIKAAFAATEILGGVAAYFVTRPALVGLARVVTSGELSEDPHDWVANHLLRVAQGLSIGTQHFAAVYLFGHGVVKLWLVAGLMRGRISYYPAAILVFGLLIAYQLYRCSVSPSLLLAAITVIDGVVIVLTWHEFQLLRHRGESESIQKR